MTKSKVYAMLLDLKTQNKLNFDIQLDLLHGKIDKRQKEVIINWFLGTYSQILSTCIVFLATKNYRKTIARTLLNKCPISCAFSCSARFGQNQHSLSLNDMWHAFMVLPPIPIEHW